MPLTDQERGDLEAMSSGQISDAMEALNMRRSVKSSQTNNTNYEQKRGGKNA